MAYVIGAVVGGLLTGTLVASAGWAVRQYLWNPNFEGIALVLAALAIAYSLHELKLITLPLPSRSWLIPRSWTNGYWSGMLGFGLVLGAGFLTLSPFAAYHAYQIFNFSVGSPAYGALLGIVYGLTRAAGISVAGLASDYVELPGLVQKFLLSRGGQCHTLNAIVLLSFSVYVLTEAMPSVVGSGS